MHNVTNPFSFCTMPMLWCYTHRASTSFSEIWDYCFFIAVKKNHHHGHCWQSLSKSMFFEMWFCLDHSKTEVVLQNCWISLMTDDFENLRKSEWVSYRTPHQRNESWSWRSSELHKVETSRYPRATGGSRFIFSSKLKLVIPIFKSFKSDYSS